MGPNDFVAVSLLSAELSRQFTSRMHEGRGERDFLRWTMGMWKVLVA